MSDPAGGSVVPEGRTRKGGRAALRRKRQKRDFSMLPALKRNLPLVEPMSQEQVEKIDDASMSILEEVAVTITNISANRLPVFNGLIVSKYNPDLLKN